MCGRFNVTDDPLVLGIRLRLGCVMCIGVSPLAAIAECEAPVKLKEKLGLSDAWLEKVLSRDSDSQ